LETALAFMARCEKNQEMIRLAGRQLGNAKSGHSDRDPNVESESLAA
jgi:hypothetical protein